MRNIFSAVTAALAVTMLPNSSAHAQSTLPGAYDPDNMLARTGRGEVPAAKLYEDKHVLAFLADRPSSQGHFLVISKTSKAPNILEMDAGALHRMLDVVRRVARAEVAALGAEGFMIRQNNGSASSIYQVHFHVIPRWKNDAFDETRKPTSVTVAELQPLANRIKAALR